MRKIILGLALLSFQTRAKAQNIESVSLFGGQSTYKGDLSATYFPNSHFKNGVIGAAIHKGLSNNLALRAELNYTVLAGNDRFGTDTNNIKRNLSFETALIELNVLGELYLLNRYQHKLSPYLIGGIGLFHFNSYTTIKGKDYYLKPLSTEGQGLANYPDRKPYSLYQPSLVYGAGIKFILNDEIDICLELSLRKTFTDYIDDVSKTYVNKADLLYSRGQLAVGAAFRGDEMKNGVYQYPTANTPRGNPKYMDTYYFAGIRIAYLLPNFEYQGDNGYRGTKNYRCPAAAF